MKLVLASHNKKKLAELASMVSAINADFEVISASELPFDAEVEETGSTFEENAVLKADFIASHGYFAVADDSGLCVDALNGAPGVYSARYSGGDDNDNIDKLLAELRDVPDEKRTASFVSCVVFQTPEGKRFIAEGRCCGKILRERMGDNGFGYDPVFLSDDFNRSFASLTAEEKNSVSHRGRAMAKLAEYLSENYSCN